MIPGLTDRNRLPRLGKIRLGEKRVSQSGKEYPAALDHFSFADVPEVAAVFGDDCKAIYPVILPHDDEEIWFPTARKAYRASGLFCACDDGETARRVFEPADEQGAAYVKANALKIKQGEMFELPCPGDECPYFEAKHCKNIGRLMVMLPTVPRVGVYEITTSSYNGIINVLSSARAIKMLAGRLAGLPFALTLKPQQVQPAGGKAKTVHVLNLEYRGSLQDLAAKRKALEEGGTLALLPEPGEAVPDDLYRNGGEDLDKKLSGAKPQGAPAPRVKMPARASQAKPIQAAPSPVEALGPELVGDDEPEPDQAEDGAPPRWTGALSEVLQKGSVIILRGRDGPEFMTQDKDVKAYAVEAIKTGEVVVIHYDITPKGGKRILEIRPEAA